MKIKKRIATFTLLIAASIAFAQNQNIAQNGAKYSFYPNGMLKSKVVSIGPHSYVKIQFNENGSIGRQKTIIMNAEEGDQRHYNKQGQLIEERRIYLAGHKYDIHLLKQFDENGKMTYYEDTTVQKYFYSNGNIKSIKDSTSEREYYENGSLKEETKDGIVYSHYTNYNDSSIVCESRSDSKSNEALPDVQRDDIDECVGQLHAGVQPVDHRVCTIVLAKRYFSDHEIIFPGSPQSFCGCSITSLRSRRSRLRLLRP